MNQEVSDVAQLSSRPSMKGMESPYILVYIFGSVGTCLPCVGKGAIFVFGQPSQLEVVSLIFQRMRFIFYLFFLFLKAIFGRNESAFWGPMCFRFKQSFTSLRKTRHRTHRTHTYTST